MPRARRGVSLMEVLISCFVLSMGLIGVAALLPLGRLAINETGKSDRAGACGRAAMREIKIRHLLDPYYSTLATYNSSPAAFPFVLANTSGSSFIVDPMGMTKRYNYGNGVQLGSLGQVFNGSVDTANPARPLPAQVTYANLLPPIDPTAAAASQIFAWHDDLAFTNPEDLKLSGTAAMGQSSRPLSTGTNGTGAAPIPNSGNYSWFFTVTPNASEVISPPSNDPRHYSVSVVVCYARDFSVNGSGATATPNDEKEAFVLAGLTTGTGVSAPVSDVVLEVASGSPTLNVRENEWIALWGQVQTADLRNPWFCYWYRVVAVGDTYPNTTTGNTDIYLTLSGPDWPANVMPQTPSGIKAPVQAAAIAYEKSVVGVYTTSVETGSGLYQDLTW